MNQGMKPGSIGAQMLNGIRIVVFTTWPFLAAFWAIQSFNLFRSPAPTRTVTTQSPAITQAANEEYDSIGASASSATAAPEGETEHSDTLTVTSARATAAPARIESPRGEAAQAEEADKPLESYSAEEP